jgi:hypothetical protein
MRLYADREPLQSLGANDMLLQEKQTDDEGAAVFSGLAPGCYIVQSSLGSGFLPTTPREQYVEAPDYAGRTVLQYMFGQLMREAFVVSLIFPVTHIALIASEFSFAGAGPAFEPVVVRSRRDRMSLAGDWQSGSHPSGSSASQGGDVSKP